MSSKEDEATTEKELMAALQASCDRQGLSEDEPAGRTIRRGPNPGLPADRQATERVATDHSPSQKGEDLPVIHIAPSPEEPKGQEHSQEFQILKLLGEGGMGMVHLARQRSLGREVALKVIRPEQLSEESVDALLREARLCGGLEHPNIVPVHALASDKDHHPQLVMKRVEGTSWLDLLENPDHPAWRDRQGDRLERHLEILMQVCNALEFAHSRGVVHRDVKPENVMVGRYGEVYLLDWGIALRLDEREQEKGGWIVGTPAYMAPEMVTGEARQTTIRTDVYLLGATLHEVLTGEARHRGIKLREVLRAAAASRPAHYARELPAELGAIANKACSHDPAFRYTSTQELRQALAGFLEHRSSITISRAAGGVLEELRAVITAPAEGDTAEQTLRVHQLFSECRFGFREALRHWPDNVMASDGLQSCIELMARHELAAGNYDSARALIADLPRPIPELDLQLEELARELLDQEDARAELERIRRDQRFQSRDWRRSAAAVLTGLAWSLVIGAIIALVRTGVVTITPWLNFGFMAGAAVETVVVAWFIRDFLFESKILRQFWTMVCCVIGANLLNRIAALVQDVPVHQVLLADMLVLLVGLAIIAVTMVPLFWWATAATALTVILSAFFPEVILEIWAILILAIHLLAAWALRPAGNDDAPVTPAT
jgi:serine/threonine-protein kinase